jgi:hypothetical protein
MYLYHDKLFSIFRLLTVSSPIIPKLTHERAKPFEHGKILQIATAQLFTKRSSKESKPFGSKNIAYTFASTRLCLVPGKWKNKGLTIYRSRNWLN